MAVLYYFSPPRTHAKIIAEFKTSFGPFPWNGRLKNRASATMDYELNIEVANVSRNITFIVQPKWSEKIRAFMLAIPSSL